MDEALQDRITELQLMSWQQQRAIAEKLELTKPSGVSWDDFCPEIAKAESASAVSKINTLDTAEAEIVEVEKSDLETSTAQPRDYQFAKGMVCPVCNQKARTGLYGELSCPVQDARCPRNEVKE